MFDLVYYLINPTWKCYAFKWEFFLGIVHRVEAFGPIVRRIYLSLHIRVFFLCLVCKSKTTTYIFSLCHS